MSQRRTRRAGRNHPRQKTPVCEPSRTPFDAEPTPIRKPRPLPPGVERHPDGGYTGTCTGTHPDGKPCAALFWSHKVVTLCSGCRIRRYKRTRDAVETLAQAA